jgi:hypothetical protein
MKVRASAIADISGKSRAYITQETKRCNLAKGDDGLYDLSDPTNAEWIISRDLKLESFEKRVVAKAAEHEQAPGKRARGRPKGSKNNPKAPKTDKGSDIEKIKKKKPTELSPVEFEELIGLPEQFKGMTMEEMVLRFGNYPGMKMYAELLDKLMSGLKKSVEIQRIRHELIERDFFKAHVKAYLSVLSDQLFDYAGNDKKMLKDFEKMIHHTQQNIDRELGKLQKIQETALSA